MSSTIKIFYYEIQNIIRGRWIIGYTLFFFCLSLGVLQFSQTVSQVISSLLSIVLLILPLVGIIFGSVNYYNSKEFIELLLTQPIGRSSVFFGKYLGLSITLAMGFVLGVATPILFYGYAHVSDIPLVLLLLISGTLLCFVFTGISFLVSIMCADKAKGLGACIVIWLYLSVIHDAIILAITMGMSQYPLEKPLLFLTFMNPVDIARMMIILRLDVAALMGYTGAVFSEYFGTIEGMGISFCILIIWVVVPTLFGAYLFQKKDF
jgi:Cu-processing system permease protein